MSTGAIAEPARRLRFNELYCPFFYHLFFSGAGGKFPASGEASLRHPARASARCCSRSHSSQLRAPGGAPGEGWDFKGTVTPPLPPQIDLSSSRGMTRAAEGACGARDVGLWACRNGMWAGGRLRVSVPAQLSQTLGSSLSRGVRGVHGWALRICARVCVCVFAWGGVCLTRVRVDTRGASP